jgi:hypothetical protein
MESSFSAASRIIASGHLGWVFSLNCKPRPNVAFGMATTKSSWE